MVVATDGLSEVAKSERLHRGPPVWVAAKALKISFNNRDV